MTDQRRYRDLHEHIEALDQAGLLHVIDLFLSRVPLRNASVERDPHVTLVYAAGVHR